MDRFITAPLYAAVYPDRKRKIRESLTHAVRLSASGEMVEVLCGRAKIDSVCEDSTLHSVTKDPTCATCVAKLQQLRSAS